MAACRADIVPVTSPNTATATIKLYFLQSDLDAYNAANGTDPDLPAGPADNVGISHFFINQYHGTSATGVPGSYTYTGSGLTNVLIQPTSVVWNAMQSRWEVTFPVSGFSGFFATGFSNTPLAIGLKSFTATNLNSSSNQIDWVVENNADGAAFDVMRSSNGSNFSTIGTIAGVANMEAYTLIDRQPWVPVNYYRLKLTDKSNTVTYSNIVIVRNQRNGGSVVIAPVPASHTLTITNTDASLNGQQLGIYDMKGRVVYQFTMGNNQTIDVSAWAAGIYNLRLPTGEVVLLVKE